MLRGWGKEASAEHGMHDVWCGAVVRQVSPGEPVRFESGLSPPPIEVTRAAARALRAVFILLYFSMIFHPFVFLRCSVEGVWQTASGKYGTYR
jgi:hypothetical protein